MFVKPGHVFQICGSKLTQLSTGFHVNASLTETGLIPNSMTVTCIVGFQNPLESLSVIITPQSEFFIDVLNLELHFRIILTVIVCCHLTMQCISRGILQKAHLTYKSQNKK